MGFYAPKVNIIYNWFEFLACHFLCLGSRIDVLCRLETRLRIFCKVQHSKKLVAMVTFLLSD